MPNFNEEIVKQYFELQGYCLQSDVKYRVPRNYSDIDLIGMSRAGDPIVVQVKGWHTTYVTRKLGTNELESFINNDLMWDAAARHLRVNKDKIQKVFVFSEISTESRRDIVEYGNSNGVKVLDFPEILEFLFRNTKTGPEPSSEVLQMVRIIKQFDKTVISILERINSELGK